jgi:Helix-turn-helix domain
MKADNQQNEKRTAFTIMTSVRDNCKQPDARKLLMFTLATYCDGAGICWPSNETLAKDIGKSRRTVKRLLKGLATDGDLEILSHGGGQTKRVLCLRRYAESGDTQMSPGVVTRSRAKRARTTSNNYHELPYSLSATDKGHSQFVRLWCERFQTITGEQYAFQGGKDGKAVKLLLTTTGLAPAQLIAIAEEAWKRPTGFWCKFATSIAGFNSRFNQIRKETKDATHESKSRNIGTANEGRHGNYRLGVR